MMIPVLETIAILNTRRNKPAASDCYALGDKIRLLKDIWDDGEDHHPPCYLAHKGEVLVVRSGTVINGGHLAVSHEHITDRSFSIYAGEYERA